MASQQPEPGADTRRPTWASLRDVAAQEIRRRIFSGELRPGAKIDQEAIAAELGTSRVPVREAVIALGGEGLLRNVPRYGAFVSSLSRDDIRDRYRIFAAVAGLAAERAAGHVDDQALAILANLTEKMEGSPDAPEQDSLNLEFHRRINLASGSAGMLNALKMLGNSLPSGFYRSEPRCEANAHRDHREILSALRRHDGPAARQAMETHFNHCGERAISLLEDRGFWDTGDEAP